MLVGLEGAGATDSTATLAIMSKIETRTVGSEKNKGAGRESKSVGVDMIINGRRKG